MIFKSGTLLTGIAIKQLVCHASLYLSYTALLYMTITNLEKQ